MSGFEISGGRIVITNGARTVATTDGTLLQFLTTEQSISGSVSFPNANKVRLYQWQYGITRAPLDSFFVTRQAGNSVGALPQKWTNQVTLAAAPSGADIFIGRVSLARTASPSHTWLAQPLSPVIPTGVAIPVNGGTSFLIEMGPGISRAFTIDIEGSNLVAKLDQSVGPAAGNFGTNGSMPPVWPPNSTSDNFRAGAENTAVGGVAGIPIWWDLGSFVAEGGTYSGTIGPGSVSAGIAWANALKLGGANEIPYSDPTNYGSTYALSISGRFGRRS